MRTRVEFRLPVEQDTLNIPVEFWLHKSNEDRCQSPVEDVERRIPVIRGEPNCTPNSDCTCRTRFTAYSRRIPIEDVRIRIEFPPKIVEQDSNAYRVEFRLHVSIPVEDTEQDYHRMALRIPLNSA
jgi:hypothetical protein